MKAGICHSVIALAAITMALVSHSAHAQKCEITVKRSGFTFLSLNPVKLSCGEANALLQQAVNMSYGKSPAGYACSQTPMGSNTKLVCDATDKSGKHIDSYWSIQGQRQR